MLPWGRGGCTCGSSKARVPAMDVALELPPTLQGQLGRSGGFQLICADTGRVAKSRSHGHALQAHTVGPGFQKIPPGRGHCRARRGLISGGVDRKFWLEATSDSRRTKPLCSHWSLMRGEALPPGKAAFG